MSVNRSRSIVADRREFLTLGGTALAGGALGAFILPAPACNPKNVAFEVETVIGALKELSPLLPGVSGVIGTAIKVAEDFNAAYQAGKFSDALAIFSNLTSLVTQIAGDVGVNSPSIKIVLAVAGIAIRAIAVLLHSQSAAPAVVAAKAGASSEQRAQAALVQRLADPVIIDAMFAQMMKMK